MPDPKQSTVRNRLLAALLPESFARLRPHLEAVDLPMLTVLVRRDVPTMHAYFLEDGLASVLAVTADGQRIEIGHVGIEGLAGSHVTHLVDRTPHELFIQIPGKGLSIPVSVLQDALEEDAALRTILLRYAHVYEVQIAHTALANGRYTVKQRLARWLLMSHDRIVGDDLTFTHEFLGLMLGVRRSGVTNAIHHLAGERMIRADRSRIRVLDRDRLEQVAGGSYGVPEREYERVIGAPLRRTADRPNPTGNRPGSRLLLPDATQG